MKHEQERNIYQFVAVTCFLAFIVIGLKYVNLKHAYNEAETNKVEYCKEVQRLKCELQSIE